MGTVRALGQDDKTLCALFSAYSLPQIWCKVGCVTVAYLSFQITTAVFDNDAYSFILTKLHFQTLKDPNRQFKRMCRCKVEKHTFFVALWNYQVVKLEYNKTTLSPMSSKKKESINSVLSPKSQVLIHENNILNLILGEIYFPRKPPKVCLSPEKVRVHRVFKLSIQSNCFYYLKVSASTIGQCKL